MKKKLNIAISVIIILLVLWATIFIIDYSRCSQLKEPVFVISSETADDGGTGTYYGLGYRVNVKKHISAEYGVQIESIHMYLLNIFILAAII